MKYIKLVYGIVIVLLITACSDGVNKEIVYDDVGTVLRQDNQISEGVNESKIDKYATTKEPLEDFIVNLNNIFYLANYKEFQKYFDEYGLYSISYFDDNRDENKAVLVFMEAFSIVCCEEKFSFGVCLIGK